MSQNCNGSASLSGHDGAIRGARIPHTLGNPDLPPIRPRAISPTPTIAPPTDEFLAHEAAAGSRHAFEQLVERYGGRVLSVVERRFGDHHAALDLAQDAWVRVFRALPRFREGSSFRSWLFAIVLNATRDEGRRRQRSPLVYVEALPQTEEPMKPIERVHIDDAIREVQEPYRTALILVDVEGLQYEDAAESLGCAVGTVKSRVHRGRLAFRDQWERMGGEKTTSGASS